MKTIIERQGNKLVEERVAIKADERYLRWKKRFSKWSPAEKDEMLDKILLTPGYLGNELEMLLKHFEYVLKMLKANNEVTPHQEMLIIKRLSEIRENAYRIIKINEHQQTGEYLMRGLKYEILDMKGKINPSIIEKYKFELQKENSLLFAEVDFMFKLFLGLVDKNNL